MAAYRRAQRIFTDMIEAVFPMDLSAYFAQLPEGAEFKNISIDAVGVHYHRGKMRDHQLPRDMRSFGKLNLKEPIQGLSPKGESERVYLVAGSCIDEAARKMAGMASDLNFSLRYDRSNCEVDGMIEVVHTPGGNPEEASPVRSIGLAFCLQYYPADS